MTAKELKNKAETICQFDFTGKRVGGDYSKNVKIYMFTEEAMSIFWSQLCKEQRELCATEYFDSAMDSGFYLKEVEVKIKNTLEPEIE